MTDYSFSLKELSTIDSCIGYTISEHDIAMSKEQLEFCLKLREKIKSCIKWTNYQEIEKDRDKQ